MFYETEVYKLWLEEKIQFFFFILLINVYIICGHRLPDGNETTSIHLLVNK